MAARLLQAMSLSARWTCRRGATQPGVYAHSVEDAFPGTALALAVPEAARDAAPSCGRPRSRCSCWVQNAETEDSSSTEQRLSELGCEILDTVVRDDETTAIILRDLLDPTTADRLAAPREGATSCHPMIRKAERRASTRMSHAENHLFRTIDRENAHESAHTRRTLVKTTAGALGSTGLLGIASGDALAGVSARTPSDPDVNTISVN